VIEARRFRDGVEGSEAIPVEGVADVIGADRGLVWVDCAEPSNPEIDVLARELGVSDLAAEDLRHGRQRTKLERYEGHFHVAVHDCELLDDRLVTGEIDVVFGQAWIVTVRQGADEPGERARLPMETVARRFDLHRMARGTTDEGLFLWALLDVVVDRYVDVTDRVDERIDAIEEVVFTEQARGEIPREVFDLRRDLVEFRRLIAPLRDVLNEILRKEVTCVGEEAVIQLHDVYDHLLRVADLAESQRELVAGLFEANLAVASNRMNMVMKRMTSWGAILLGSTLIAGIYGMNFEHMPELHWYLGYPLALGMMAVLTVGLVTYFKRRDWL
jgi:magnesium transporter